MKPATLTTIHTDRLLAICNHCANTVELNKRQLIDKYGGDCEVPRLKSKLRCTRCRSDNCDVQLALPEDKFA